MPWYAVAVDIPRTGRSQMEYVNAPNKTVAGETFPGEIAVYGPYISEAAAEKAHPTGSGGTAKTPAGDVNAQPSKPFSALQDIGNFFHVLSEGSTWTRVGEVLLGGILVYAGVRALTHGSPAVGSGARKTATAPVKKAAKTAASVAAPEVRFATRTAAKRVAPKATKRVATHRQLVRKYGAKKPYVKPEPRPSRPRVSHTTRESHIYHHKGPKP